MKNFFKGLIEVKTSACVLFTAAMFIYLFFCLIYDNREVSTTVLWGLFWMSAAGSLLQSVCFSEWLIKKMRYTRRSLLFVLLFFPALSLVAWKTEWFPVDRAEAWTMFIGIFLLIFIGMTVGFDIYFQLSGRKYDGLLGQYRRKKEEEERGG